MSICLPWSCVLIKLGWLVIQIISWCYQCYHVHSPKIANQFSCQSNIYSHVTIHATLIVIHFLYCNCMYFKYVFTSINTSWYASLWILGHIFLKLGHHQTNPPPWQALSAKNPYSNSLPPPRRASWQHRVQPSIPVVWRRNPQSVEILDPVQPQTEANFRFFLGIRTAVTPCL